MLVVVDTDYGSGHAGEPKVLCAGQEPYSQLYGDWFMSKGLRCFIFVSLERTPWINTSNI